jgi:cytoplasmic iron level regulating protein YaaA (DUF328/UPF0246 family)
VLILLPPSEGKAEGKAAGRSGRALDLTGLSLPALTPARDRVISSIVDLCTVDGSAARRALGLTDNQHGEVDRNARLRSAPTLPAGRLYTGVLYEALDLATLPAAAKRRAHRSILVFSGLWGVLRLTDRVPAYRCSATAKLPGIGGLSAYWRRELTSALDELAATSGPVLDLRSTGYTGMWRPANSLTVRVLHDGAIVSHFNKATKGRLVRDLLSHGARLGSQDAIVEALRELKYTVECPAPGRLDVQRVA